MRALLIATLLLSACSDSDPDQLVTGEEIALRYAEATCKKLDICNGTPFNACMIDELQFLRSWYPNGFPEDATEEEVVACEDYVAESPCGTLTFRAEPCDFGQ